MILQGETPFMQSTDCGFKTEAGMGSSLPQAPQGDPETMTSKFYKDNHYWVLDEVEKYLDQNQSEIKDYEERRLCERDLKDRQREDDKMGEENESDDGQGLMAAVDNNSSNEK